jgi:transposase
VTNSSKWAAGLENVVVTEAHEVGDTHLHLLAQSITPVFARDCCADPDLVSDGWRTNRRIIVDTEQGGRATEIHFRVKLAKCRRCRRRSQSEVLRGIREGHHMTERLYRYLGRQSLDEVNTRLAKRVGVSEGTIRNIFAEFTTRDISELRRRTPRVLALDEVLIRRRYRAVLANVEAGTILDILPDRRGSLSEFLEQLRIPTAVEVFVTDMHPPYLALRERFLPKAMHVADRFHVVRRANNALERIRKLVVADLPAKDQAMVGLVARAMVARWEKLSETNREMLGAALDRAPVLRAAYHAKERFMAMYEQCATPAEARAYYADWLCSLDEEVRPVFEQKVAIMPAWQPAVFGYFEHPFGTALVEGFNSVLKRMVRNGAGLTFETLRSKFMLSKQLEKRAPRLGLGGARFEPLAENLGIDATALMAMMRRELALEIEGMPPLRLSLPADEWPGELTGQIRLAPMRSVRPSLSWPPEKDDPTKGPTYEWVRGRPQRIKKRDV